MSTFKYYLAAWMAIATIVFEVRALPPGVEDDANEFFRVENDYSDYSDESIKLLKPIQMKNLKPIPFLAFLRDKAGDIFCGASIISNKHILTAASCLDNKEDGEIIVTLDYTKSFEGSTIYYLSEIFIPKEYRPPNKINVIAKSDIAVLRLNKKLEGDIWRMVKIARNEDLEFENSGNEWNAYHTALKSEYNVKVEKFRAKLNSKYMEKDSKDCAKYYQFSKQDFLCRMIITFEKHFLHGSPLIYKNENNVPYVRGITLNSEMFRGKNEREAYPAFFTNVANYELFIKNAQK